jgi:hypothetical protein
METLTKLEPARKPRVNKTSHSRGTIARHERRVAALENRMTTVEAVAAVAAENAKVAAENSVEILAIVNATKGAAAFAKKHGPRFVSFVTGGLAVLGIGNPDFWRYVQAFFG